MSEDIADMIGDIAAGNMHDAAERFDDIMSQKVHAALDAKRIELGQTMIQRHQEMDSEDI